MKVDTTPVVSNNRKSIRIQTNKQYTGGLFVIDAVHMPAACGAWPAFWTVGPANWPQNGYVARSERLGDLFLLFELNHDVHLL